MGRIIRTKLLYDECFAHIFSRSIEKRKIFETKQDFVFFLKQMVFVKKMYAFKIFHYCIMQTHFHLMVQIGELKNFAQGMKVLKKTYTHHYNKRYKRRGALWQDRYRSKLIENEDYMFTCGRYIENNPVDIGLVEQATDWPYSSSRYYYSGENNVIVDDYSKAMSMRGVVIGQEDFLRDCVVGSDLFKFQVTRKFCNSPGGE